MNPIHTGRLIIRRLTLDDAPFIFRLLNEPSFIKNIGDKKIKTLEDAVKDMKKGPLSSYKKNGFGLNCVVLKETEESIGMCGLIKRPELDDVDLGYAFLPEFGSRGYAIEAARAMQAYGYNQLSLSCLAAIVNEDNPGSIRLLEKLGFKYKKDIYYPKADADVQLYMSNNPDVAAD